MSVFRVEKTQNYTVMSNYHLRDFTLTLKAKGLLSQMLSLPEEWDYTLLGLSAINREGIDAIREAIKEKLSKEQIKGFKKKESNLSPEVQNSLARGTKLCRA